MRKIIYTYLFVFFSINLFSQPNTKKLNHNDNMVFNRTSNNNILKISIKEKNFVLGEQYFAGRTITKRPDTSASGAFYLPKIKFETFEIPDKFVANTSKGGCCNIDLLHYCPHNITHLETSAHVLDSEAFPPTIKDLKPENLSGTGYLIDLSNIENELIEIKHVKKELEQLEIPISVLAIKTKASLLDESYDFSGKNFMALSKKLAKYISEYNNNNSDIKLLILDLPSIDPEKDNGKLLAHRAYFQIPDKGSIHKDNKHNALIELAYFRNIPHGYYFITIVPNLFETNAVAVNVLLQKLILQK